MSRENLLRAGIVLLLALAAAWLATVTEWREVEVPTPARGEAVKNRLYALQSLARQLGVRVTRKTQLDAMPPPAATLVLTSRHWNLFPQRAQRLRQWVQAGGQLVISLSLAEQDPFENWLPIARREVRVSEAASRAARRGRRGNDPDTDCHAASEPVHVPPSYAEGRSLRLCSHVWRRAQTKDAKTSLWSLDDEHGSEMLRLGMTRVRSR